LGKGLENRGPKTGRDLGMDKKTGRIPV